MANMVHTACERATRHRFAKPARNVVLRLLTGGAGGSRGAFAGEDYDAASKYRAAGRATPNTSSAGTTRRRLPEAEQARTGRKGRHRGRPPEARARSDGPTSRRPAEHDQPRAPARRTKWPQAQVRCAGSPLHLAARWKSRARPPAEDMYDRLLKKSPTWTTPVPFCYLKLTA